MLHNKYKIKMFSVSQILVIVDASCYCDKKKHYVELGAYFSL